MHLFPRMFQACVDSLKDTISGARSFFPMIIAIVILLKILQTLDLMKYLAMPLAPIMELMGLPAEFGLVWASAMLVNIYSALALMPGILISLPAITVEQSTILGLIILIAHNLIIETKIVGQCRISMSFQFGLRVVTAIISGIVLHLICSAFGIWQEDAKILLVPQIQGNLLDWAISEFLNLVQIFCFIFFVMLFNRLMNFFKISDILSKWLRPLFNLVGLSSAATNTMLVGQFLGLIYGSSIIIKDTREGRISKSDIFAAMSFLSIAHAIVEDTILLMLIGGSLWGLLGFRFLVAFIVGFAINLLYIKKKQLAVN